MARADVLDKRLLILEARQPRKKTKEEIVIARCTDEELQWIVEISQKPDLFDDPEIEKNYWDIMRRHGWFDEPD